MAKQQTQRIPINTPGGTMHVWTQRNGSSPTMRLLLLHGGPGATHEYFRSFESWFPRGRASSESAEPWRAGTVP
ncbi:MAG: hypothetical protein ACLFP6_12400, partial [Spirochaetaceae bacterium]